MKTSVTGRHGQDGEGWWEVLLGAAARDTRVTLNHPNQRRP